MTFEPDFLILSMVHSTCLIKIIIGYTFVLKHKIQSANLRDTFMKL